MLERVGEGEGEGRRMGIGVVPNVRHVVEGRDEGVPVLGATPAIVLLGLVEQARISGVNERWGKVHVDEIQT
jgi:hypothetical protein